MVKTATAQLTTARASATAIISVFMCVLPSKKLTSLYSRVNLGASRPLAIKETPQRVCNEFPLCTRILVNSLILLRRRAHVFHKSSICIIAAPLIKLGFFDADF